MTDELEEQYTSRRQILTELAGHVGWITAAGLALNLPYTESEIKARCEVLRENDLITEHPEAVAYQLTDRGSRTVLSGFGPNIFGTNLDDGEREIEARREWEDRYVESPI